MKKIIMITLLLLSTSLWAQQRGPLSKLNLSEEQKQKIMQLRQNNPAPLRQDMQHLITLKSELSQLLASDNNDSKLLKEKYLVIKDLELLIAEKKFTQMMKIRSILTPAQREIAAKLFLSPGPMSKGGHGMRNGRGMRNGMPQENCKQND